LICGENVGAAHAATRSVARDQSCSCGVANSLTSAFPKARGTLSRAALVLTLLLNQPALADALTIGFLGQARPPPLTIAPLDTVPADEGVAGARLGIADDRTTGLFLGQDFALVEHLATDPADAAAEAKAMAGQGVRFIVADLDAPALLAAAEAAPEAMILNAGAPDDALRNADCRVNLLHTLPSRAMLADGLAQYLVWKRWTRWFLVVGRTDGDRLLADAFGRAAEKFGAEIAAEADWTFRPGNARSDSGHVVLQTEIPTFTDVGDYDVLVVADEADEFGAYLDGRTMLPRPVAGTHGLVTTGWSAVTEQWGATQLQDRFRALAGRWMTARDYAAWLAVRSVGEAAARTGGTDPAAIAAYLRGPDFLLAGFKGQGLTFRAWDGQMRQPMLIAGPRLLVSVSPQDGFLHQGNELDSLGSDEQETTCRF
jgi:ABC transporter substrate binding protein (PQQ-dependent alcohol dehydrogenase system)